MSRPILPEGPPGFADSATPRALIDRIDRELARDDGFLSFARFMELALYAPEGGYYAAGERLFGAAGDFVTAPEISPLFGRCLARQIADLIEPERDAILEFGAGSGRLAFELLTGLEARGCLPRRYEIVELSARLRERQDALLRRHASHLAERLVWHDRLPQRFRGVVLANEVLDAMPVHLIQVEAGGILERGVVRGPGPDGFTWGTRPAGGELQAAAAALALPEGYRTEIHLHARAFIRTFGSILERGAMLLIDYGFPRHEYYHPQRRTGTLMCHHRHRAHSDPLALIGRQDITAHVDFTAIAEAATEAGLDLLGYASQAQFLINCGITEALLAADPANAAAYAPAVAGAHTLLSAAEMGELFKVMALGRGVSAPLRGFRTGDRRHRL